MDLPTMAPGSWLDRLHHFSLCSTIYIIMIHNNNIIINNNILIVIVQDITLKGGYRKFFLFFHIMEWFQILSLKMTSKKAKFAFLGRF